MNKQLFRSLSYIKNNSYMFLFIFNYLKVHKQDFQQKIQIIQEKDLLILKIGIMPTMAIGTNISSFEGVFFTLSLLPKIKNKLVIFFLKYDNNIKKYTNNEKISELFIIDTNIICKKITIGIDNSDIPEKKIIKKIIYSLKKRKIKYIQQNSPFVNHKYVPFFLNICYIYFPKKHISKTFKILFPIFEIDQVHQSCAI